MDSKANYNPLTSAQQELVSEHQKLVYFVAKPYRYQLPKEVYEDLISFLTVRLCISLTSGKFNPEDGTPCSAYVLEVLRRIVPNFFRDYGWVIKPPRSLRDPRIFNASYRSEKENHHGENLDVLFSCAVPVSLDDFDISSTEENSLTAMDSPESEVVAGIFCESMLAQIKCLISSQQFQHLRAKMERLSSREIAKQFGISPEEEETLWLVTQRKLQAIYLQIAESENYDENTLHPQESGIFRSMPPVSTDRDLLQTLP